MTILNTIIPVGGYIFFWIGHLNQANGLIHEGNKKNYQYGYIVASLCGAILQFFTAFILLFAVIKIRYIIG